MPSVRKKGKKSNTRFRREAHLHVFVFLSFYQRLVFHSVNTGTGTWQISFLHDENYHNTHFYPIDECSLWHASQLSVIVKCACPTKIWYTSQLGRMYSIICWLSCQHILYQLPWILWAFCLWYIERKLSVKEYALSICESIAGVRTCTM